MYLKKKKFPFSLLLITSKQEGKAIKLSMYLVRNLRLTFQLDGSCHLMFIALHREMCTDGCSSGHTDGRKDTKYSPSLPIASWICITYVLEHV